MSKGERMKSPHFDRAFDELLNNEGGYSNNPKDPGGETMWGITSATARHAGYAGPMRDMPKEVAKEIYRERYWHQGLDRMTYSVAFQVFDSSVNSGKIVAARWLQKAVGVKDDGIIGPVTMAAVEKIDPLVIVIKFNAARLVFLASLPSWQTFGRGWVNRIASNMNKAAE